jgi:hypothetical protein
MWLNKNGLFSKTTRDSLRNSSLDLYFMIDK